MRCLGGAALAKSNRDMEGVGVCVSGCVSRNGQKAAHPVCAEVGEGEGEGESVVGESVECSTTTTIDTYPCAYFRRATWLAGMLSTK